jgi:hypothetical protein
MWQYPPPAARDAPRARRGRRRTPRTRLPRAWGARQPVGGCTTLESRLRELRRTQRRTPPRARTPLGDIGAGSTAMPWPARARVGCPTRRQVRPAPPWSFGTCAVLSREGRTTAPEPPPSISGNAHTSGPGICKTPCSRQTRRTHVMPLPPGKATIRTCVELPPSFGCRETLSCRGPRMHVAAASFGKLPLAFVVWHR